MLTKAGAKLLDFGLAKPGVTHGFTGRTIMVTAGDASPTMTTPPNLTGQGAVLRTIQYMAPEVLEGADADARSEIFAFGCVLDEMLTGRKAFVGKSQVSLIGAILKDQPAPIADMSCRLRSSGVVYEERGPAVIKARTQRRAAKNDPRTPKPRLLRHTHATSREDAGVIARVFRPWFEELKQRVGN